jgi:RHH-type proline utilization regulon transcriptional repressor/proline dehydrogenase/delta 1-pyrroline-5-carboxylate dehydrogenase
VAGGLLLYCPIVRADEIEASLAYLARRFDENTSPENFLRAMFSLTPGSAAFDEQAARFRRAVEARHSVSTEPRRRPLPQPEQFANEPDSDFTDARTRTAALAALAEPPRPRVEIIDEVAPIDAVIARAVAAQRDWARCDTRAGILRRVADVFASERDATLALMANEGAKTLREGDPEVSEAIDFARWYALHPPAPECTPVGVVVVASPWNFPYAIPAGGVLAALMAGNAVILKPPPETRRTARHLVDQLHRAGVPADVVQFVACPDDEVGRHLITHPDVGTVVLTGAHATAQLFLDWKPSMRLLAETSGKNALVVTAAADEDAAIRDLVRSAFGHGGQKCSAASLAILEASVYDDPTFRRRLADAVLTLRVGEAEDPATVVGPLIAPPGEVLDRALTTLDPGETWLVEPRRLGERLWTPGVKLGVLAGSWFHRTECFGPVLGVMRADDLAHAIALQNDNVFGLTGGIHSLDETEVDEWLAQVEVGNAYVNRHITGAIVGRQPFGGWKRSSVGGAPKAGGPSYVSAFATPASQAVIETHYDDAWTNWFSREHELVPLVSERNVLRYRPLRRVVVRAGADTPAGALEAACAAAGRCRVEVDVSHTDDEDELALAQEIARLRPDRLRALTCVSDALLRACHRMDVTVDRTPVSPDGMVELIRWVREQAVSETRHRYGRVRERATPLP